MPLNTQIDALATAIGLEIKPLKQIVRNIGSQYLLDPNEVNGIGSIGIWDNSNTQDLGNVGAANLNRLTGGFVFPFDVKVVSFYAWHSNSNAAAEPWGWVISRQAKTAASNTVTTTFMRDESFDRGDGHLNLRNYGNNQNQLTSLVESDFVDNTVPAGEVINIAVGAPTAVTTNYYVQVQAGYIVFERI